MSRYGPLVISSPRGTRVRIRYTDHSQITTLDKRYADLSGQFFRNGEPIDPPPYTQDAEVQRRLWEVSEQLTGLA
jgi:hypothetical protein